MESPVLTRLRKFTPICLALLFFMLSGCTVECLKPGVAVRSDWSLELNRNKATKSRKKDGSGHHSPCGRTGCLRCALASKTVEDQEEKNATRETPQLFPNPLVMYPPPYPVPLPGLPGMIPPGPPQFNPLPYPVPPQQPTVMIAVIDPKTGQRSVMQPALPGMPGILMQNAMTGQPVLVNPNPLPPQQVFQPTLQPVPGMHPGMNPVIMPVQGTYSGNQGVMTVQAYTAQGYPAIPPGVGEEGESSSQSAPKSSMPYPKYHGVPTKPVFQRTEGLATEQDVENEEKARLRQLEKALGTTIPEGAKISANGVNQQLLPQNGRTGGGPANGLPFSLAEKLGLSGKSTKSVSVSSHEKSLRELQELQQRQQQILALEEAGLFDGLRKRPQKNGFFATHLLGPASQEVQSERLAAELARRENVDVAQIRNIMVFESETMPHSEMILAEQMDKAMVLSEMPTSSVIVHSEPSYFSGNTVHSGQESVETEEKKIEAKPLRQVAGTTADRVLPVPIIPPALPNSPSSSSFLLEEFEVTEKISPEQEIHEEIMSFDAEEVFSDHSIQQTQQVKHVAPQPEEASVQPRNVPSIPPKSRPRVSPVPGKPYLGGKI